MPVKFVAGQVKKGKLVIICLQGNHLRITGGVLADYSYITEENIALVDIFVLKRLRENVQQLYSHSRKMGNRPGGVFSKYPSAGSIRQKLDIIDRELIKRKRKEQK